MITHVLLITFTIKTRMVNIFLSTQSTSLQQVFVHEYKPWHIPLKYMHLIKRSDHIRPSYLTYMAYLSNMLICAIRLPHSILSTLYTILNINYHGNKTWDFLVFPIVVGILFNKWGYKFLWYDFDQKQFAWVTKQPSFFELNSCTHDR